MEIKKRLSRGFFPAVFILSCFLPFISFAQSATVTPETQTIEKAKVISVSNQTTETIQGTGATEPVQTLTAQIVSGPDANQVVTFTNDYTQLAPGDIFYLRHTTSSLDGTDYYSVSDPYRLNVLLELAVALVVLIIVFGGLQGVRGFMS